MVWMERGDDLNQVVVLLLCWSGSQFEWAIEFDYANPNQEDEYRFER